MIKEFKEFWQELGLILGVIWVWIGHIFTPANLMEVQTIIQWLTTLTVFLLALYRFFRVLKNPNDEYER